MTVTRTSGNGTFGQASDPSRRQAEVDEVLQLFPDALADADLATQRLTFVNRLFTILTGYTTADVVAGVPALRMFDLDSQMRIVAKVQSEVDIPERTPYQPSGRQEFVPVRVRRSDGSWFAGEVHGSYVLGDDGRHASLRFVLRDMEDNESLKRLLDLSSARWETLRQLSPSGIFHMTEDGRITEVNQRLTELTGMEPERLLGYGYMESFHADGASAVKAAIRGAIENPHPDPAHVFRLECRLRYAVDGERWVLVETLSQRDTAGNRAGIVGIVTDITEQKVKAVRNAEELEASETLLELVLANTSAAIMVIDEEGRFVRVNAATVKLSGYSEQELLTMRALDLAGPPLHPPSEVPIPRVLAGESLVGFLTQARARDGRLLQGELTTSPLHQPDGRRLSLMTYVDLTDRLKADAMVAQAQKMESIGMVAGGIAHDFNNLLSIVTGSAGLARMLISNRDAVIEEIVQSESAAGRAAELIRQLMTVARRQEVAPRIVDLHESIHGATEIMRRLVGRGIEIETYFDSEPSVVKLDPGQFEQVLFNLAANARDAMDGEGRLTLRTAREQVGSKPSVVLTVADTGCGMDAATCQRIFEPFFTTKAEGQGTGLGLATSYGIVTRARGEISVESEPGVGTTFTITLPCASGEEHTVVP